MRKYTAFGRTVIILAVIFVIVMAINLTVMVMQDRNPEMTGTRTVVIGTGESISYYYEGEEVEIAWFKYLSQTKALNNWDAVPTLYPGDTVILPVYEEVER